MIHRTRWIGDGGKHRIHEGNVGRVEGDKNRNRAAKDPGGLVGRGPIGFEMHRNHGVIPIEYGGRRV